MAILAEASESIPFLTQIELDFDKLVEVARYADRERAFCNANDPKGFSLILMNAKVARGLREMFCGKRWEIDETDNQPGIKNPSLRIRIIPCNFDENAGNRLVDPTNRAEKGSASKAKVHCNATAWIPGLPDPTENEDEDDYVTFVFGTWFDDDQGLRAELSRPRSFASGRYTRFETRVILLNGTEDSSPVDDSKTDRGGPTEIIDIAIKRK